MNIGCTGARPNSIGGCYRWKDKKRKKIREYMKKQMIELLDNHKEEEMNFYSGMALGIDQDFFSVLLELRDEYNNIKLIAAVPFRNQYKIWRKEDDLARYFTFLEKADEVIYVDELEGTKYYSRPSDNKEIISEKLKMRNKFIVDRIELLYAYPSESANKSSGTLNCMRYAMKQKVKIITTILSVKK